MGLSREKEFPEGERLRGRKETGKKKAFCHETTPAKSKPGTCRREAYSASQRKHGKSQLRANLIRKLAYLTLLVYSLIVPPEII